MDEIVNWILSATIIASALWVPYCIWALVALETTGDVVFEWIDAVGRRNRKFIRRGNYDRDNVRHYDAVEFVMFPVLTTYRNVIRNPWDVVTVLDDTPDDEMTPRLQKLHRVAKNMIGVNE